MGRSVFHIWGYSVCLCPIKRTPGLYGLTKSDLNEFAVFVFSINCKKIMLPKRTLSFNYHEMDQCVVLAHLSRRRIDEFMV